MVYSSPSNYWIKQGALTFTLNALNDPDKLSVAVSAGAVIMAYAKVNSQTIIDYNAGHNYRTWALSGSPTHFDRTEKVYVYARLSKVGDTAMLVFPYQKLPIDPALDNSSNDIDPNYYYILLGALTPSVVGGTQVDRSWDAEEGLSFGTLDTDEQWNEQSSEALDRMFRIDSNNIIWAQHNLTFVAGARLLLLRMSVLGDSSGSNAAEITSVTQASNITSPNFAGSEASIPTTAAMAHYASLLEAIYNARFLRKDQNDSTPHKLTMGEAEVTGDAAVGGDLTVVGDESVGGDIDVEGAATLKGGAVVGKTDETTHQRSGDLTVHGDTKSSDFSSGMQDGHGWKIDKFGNAELESAVIRSSLTVQEMIVNRQSAQEGDSIFSENDQFESVEQETIENVTYYTITVKEKWEGYYSAQKTGNIIKGIINTLAAKEAGISDYSETDVDKQGIDAGGNLYYTSFMQVVERWGDTGSLLHKNQFKVILYGDTDVPSQKNFPPCRMMVGARWGCWQDPNESGISPDEKASRHRRQTLFMVSVTDGRITKYSGVNKPILEDWMCGMSGGETPDFIQGWSAIAPKLIDGYDYFYAQGIIVSDFIKVDSLRRPIVNHVDCGEWVDGNTILNPTPGHGIYLLNEYNEISLQWETQDVWHSGAKWRCNMHQPRVVNNVSYYDEPKWGSPYWTFIEGNSELSLEIRSSNGSSFVKNAVGTTLSPLLQFSNEDITDTTGLVFNWKRSSDKRTSETIAEDNQWNGSHTNTKNLTLTNNDIPSWWDDDNRIRFTCEVTVGGKIIPADYYVLLASKRGASAVTCFFEQNLLNIPVDKNGVVLEDFTQKILFHMVVEDKEIAVDSFTLNEAASNHYAAMGAAALFAFEGSVENHVLHLGENAEVVSNTIRPLNGLVTMSKNEIVINIPKNAVLDEHLVAITATGKDKDGLVYAGYDSITIQGRYIAKDGKSTPAYFDEWFAWSNVESSPVNTEPTPNGGWSVDVPNNTYNYAYLWRKTVRHVWNDSTGTYTTENPQYVRLSGTNGVSIHTRGQVASAAKRGNGTAYIIGENGTEQLITLSDGDAVTQLDDGHLYQWVTEGSGKWLDLGEFKGDAGKTYYTHVAWASAVTFTTPFAVEGQLTKGNASAVTDFRITPDSTVRPYMGYLVNESLTDPGDSEKLNYSWAYVKGADGVRGDYKSRVFCRTNKNMSTHTPTGGTYESPIPNPATVTIDGESVTWTDGIPSGTGKLWTSVRQFKGDGTATSWSTPVLDSDTTTLDIEFSPSGTQPAAPAGNTPFADHSSEGWYDPSHLPSGQNMIWRAERKVSNGAYDGDWVITRIYGEKGDAAYVLDIDNEYDSVATDSTGKVKAQEVKSTIVRLYHGSTEVDISAVTSINIEGAPASSVATFSQQAETNGKGRVLTWTFLAGKVISDYEIKITYSIGGVGYNDVFTIVASKGQPIFQLKPSYSALPCTRDEANDSWNNPPAFSLKVVKVDGDSTAEINAIGNNLSDNGLVVRYSTSSMPATVSDGSAWPTANNSLQVPSSVQNVYIALFDPNNKLADRDTIPLVKDGPKGASGGSCNCFLKRNIVNVPVDTNGYTLEEHHEEIPFFMIVGTDHIGISDSSIEEGGSSHYATLGSSTISFLDDDVYVEGHVLHLGSHGTVQNHIITLSGHYTIGYTSVFINIPKGVRLDEHSVSVTVTGVALDGVEYDGYDALSIVGKYIAQDGDVPVQAFQWTNNGSEAPTPLPNGAELGAWSLTASNRPTTPGAHYLWMTQSVKHTDYEGNETYEGWSQATRISGDTGSPGEDARDVEWIYYRSDSSVTPDTPSSIYSQGWTDHPIGVDANHKYEYASFRIKPAGYDTSWGPFQSPILWSHYGRNGVDGDGTEYVFVKTNTYSAPSIVVKADGYKDSNNHTYLDDEFLPKALVNGSEVECTDDPSTPDTNNKYVWVSKRTKGNPDSDGKRAWVKYQGEMSLWSNFAESAFVADLSNEADQFGTDSESKVLIQQQRSTKVSLFYGSQTQELTSLTAQLKYEDGTSVPSSVAEATPTLATGVVVVTVKANNTSNNHTEIIALITATCSKGTKTLDFTLQKVMSGQAGVSPTIYQLSPTQKVLPFSRNTSNGLTPSSQSTQINVSRTIGNTTEILTTAQQGLTYKWGWDNSNTAQETAKNIGTSISVSADNASLHSSVWVELSTGDRETIPLVKDGADAYSIMANPLVVEILTNENGSVIESSSDAHRVDVVMYKGGSNTALAPTIGQPSPFTHTGFGVVSVSGSANAVNIIPTNGGALAAPVEVSLPATYNGIPRTIKILVVPNRKGQMGANAIHLDLNNEMDAIQYAGGTKVGADVTSQATLYNGRTPITNGVTWAKDNSSTATGTVSNSGLVTVTGLPANALRGVIVVKATYLNVDYYATFTVDKLVDKPKYYLQPDKDIIAANTSVTSGSATLTIRVWKDEINANGGITRTNVSSLGTELKLFYQVNQYQPGSLSYSDGSGTITGIPYTNGQVVVWLTDSTGSDSSKVTGLLDYESVPVVTVQDGQPGAKGDAARQPYEWGKWSDFAADTTNTFVANKYETPYFIKEEEVTSGGVTQVKANKWQWVGPDGTYNATQAGTPSSQNANWELMVTDFKYLISEAQIADYGKFGAGIFNKDYAFSQYGRIEGDANDIQHYKNFRPEFFKGQPYSMFEGSKTISGNMYYDTSHMYSFGEIFLEEEINYTFAFTITTATANLKIRLFDLTTNQYVSSFEWEIYGSTTKQTQEGDSNVLAGKDGRSYLLCVYAASSNGSVTISKVAVSASRAFKPNIYIDWLKGEVFSQLGRFINVTIEGVMNNLIQEINSANYNNYGRLADLAIITQDTVKTLVIDPTKVGSVIRINTKISNSVYIKQLLLPCAYNALYDDTYRSIIFDYGLGLTIEEMRQCVGKVLYILPFDATPPTQSITILCGGYKEFNYQSMLIKSIYAGQPALDDFTPLTDQRTKEVIPSYTAENTGLYFYKLECKMSTFNSKECIYWELEELSPAMTNVINYTDL